jgi:hypothetical protein
MPGFILGTIKERNFNTQICLSGRIPILYFPKQIWPNTINLVTPRSAATETRLKNHEGPPHSFTSLLNIKHHRDKINP